jgi:HSP20 family molecular chaperone IbpA
VAEELDYRLEAASQEDFAAAYAGDPDVWVPQVVAVTDHVLVSEWMGGIPLARIIAGGTIAERNRAGVMIARFLFSGPARVSLLHADPHPGNFRLLADGRLGVLDFGAVDRLPDGLPPLIGKLLRLVHEDRDLDEVGDELRSHGFLRDGVSIDLAELRAFLAPLAEPSRAETFRFSREWLRGEAMRVARLRSSGVLRRLNLPPSYVLIHRVSTAGIGVLCQLECEGPFRAEMLRWMPGYADPPTAAPQPQPQPEPQPASAPLAPETELAQPVRPTRPASSAQPAKSAPRAELARPARSARPAERHQITWPQVEWEDIMAKLPRPQAPAIFRAMFPGLADWLESPWTGPPPFLVAQAFRVEEAVQDDGYVIRAELPGLDPDKDIEVTVDGRTLTIRAERRQEDSGPYRSEFRYGSFSRSVRLPTKVDASDVAARYDKGVLEVSVPVREAKPEGTRVPIEKAD